MPACCERSRFGFTIADNATCNQVGIVEHCAVSVEKGIAELSSFVDRAWCLWGSVTWNSAGIRKLGEQFFQSGDVTTDVGINLAVRALEISVRDDARTTVT